MQDVIHIEVCKSPVFKGTWNVRIGDLKGSTEHSNSSKTEVIEAIVDEINQLERDDNVREACNCLFCQSKREEKNQDMIKARGKKK